GGTAPRPRPSRRCRGRLLDDAKGLTSGRGLSHTRGHDRLQCRRGTERYRGTLRQGEWLPRRASTPIQRQLLPDHIWPELAVRLAVTGGGLLPSPSRRGRIALLKKQAEVGHSVAIASRGRLLPPPLCGVRVAALQQH